MSGGSSRAKEKGGRREDFDEPVYHFLVETKRDFTKECPLRGYDNRKENWPKYRHGEDCLVQMFVKGFDGGRRFFKCPRAEVISFKIFYSRFFLHCFVSYRPNSLHCSINL
jgi:hypothetical protein